MSIATTANTGRILVKTPSDLMTATVTLKGGRARTPIKPDEVVKALQQAGIVIDETAEDRIAAFVEQASNPSKRSDEPFVIVQGKPAQMGRDGRLVWDKKILDTLADWTKDEAEGFFPTNAIVSLEEGAVVGVVEPPVRPANGVDVKGAVVTGTGSYEPLMRDRSLRSLPGDPTTVIAAAAGKLVELDHVLRIVPCRHVTGDAGLETGRIHTAKNVHIDGRISDRVEIRSVRSVIVGQAIEAAHVVAGEDVVVCGGIVARNLGSVSAGRDIWAKYATMANLVAGGDIRIIKQLMNSKVFAGGKLIAGRASVIGGIVYAEQGVEVASLGSAAGVPTRVVVGVDTSKIRELAAIDRSAKRSRSLIDQTRGLIEPMLSDTKQLAPGQKRQAVDLIQRIEKSERTLTEKEKRRDELIGGIYSETVPSVRVATMIYGPTTICIGNRETLVHHEMTGPISIELQKIKRHTQLVAVSKNGAAKSLTFDRCSVDDLIAAAGIDESVEEG